MLNFDEIPGILHEHEKKNQINQEMMISFSLEWQVLIPNAKLGSLRNNAIYND